MSSLESRMSRRPFLTRVALPAALITIAGCASDMADPDPRISSDSAEMRAGHARPPLLTPQQSGTTNRLQAVSPVNAQVVWASGVAGTYVLTTDGGATWQAHVVPGAETLQFRDVEAVSARVAYLLAAGVGTDSRIYKTEDGGATWSLLFENQDPNGFYDCFTFWSRQRGIAMGDSVDGRFPVLQTGDGRTWEDIGDALPAALPGEAAFAASGTCVATQGSRRAWIATGAAAQARVLATTDGGRTWSAHETPIVQGTASSGGFTIAFRDRSRGILGGGDLALPAELSSSNFARSRDGGRSWQLGTPAPFPGAVFGLSYALGPGHRGEEDEADGGEHGDEGRTRVRVVATGPGGAAWSPDEGETWLNLAGATNYWAVAFASSRTGWLVGTEGRILKIEFP